MGSTGTFSPDGGSWYIGDYSGNVHAYNEKTGTKEWMASPHKVDGLNHDILGNPARSMNGQTLYVGTKGFIIYGINTANGNTEWTFNSGGAIYSTAVASTDGKLLFFGNDDGNVFALNA